MMNGVGEVIVASESMTGKGRLSAIRKRVSSIASIAAAASSSAWP
jgi:hypothetical protein